jgi:hypothetical protein
VSALAMLDIIGNAAAALVSWRNSLRGSVMAWPHTLG